MAIFNVLPDPDEPVLDGYGFGRHTCQQPQAPQQQQFYYNGQVVTPAPQPTFNYNMPAQADSRRYDAPAPTVASPWAQQPAAPQSALGFNQLVEDSRRYQATQPVQQQPSPWTIQPQQAVQAPVPVAPAMYPSQYDPKYSAVYNCHPSFDKKAGVWGNTDVTQPCVAPTINWNAAQPQPVAQPQTAPGYVSISYPITTQPMQEDWMEIVRKNFPK